MNKRYRTQSGKPIKFANTRAGKRDNMRRILSRLAAAGGIASAVAMISTIRSTPAKTPEQKIKKAMAIAKIVFDAHKSTLSEIRNYRIEY